jgi:hypothetical protein
MSRTQRIRDTLNRVPDTKYFEDRTSAGWRLVAVEWETESEAGLESPTRHVAEVPFGLRVAADCQHLEENPPEMDALTYLLELVVQDISLPRMAEQLNNKGYRTREGFPWGPVSIFKILPRLVEIGPRIFSDSKWQERRRQLANVTWNS